MFLQQFTRCRSLLVLALVFTLVGSTVVPTFAGANLNTIDPVAHITDSGRQIAVTGPIVCTAGEQVTLRVTVTQRTTGAVAQGRTHFLCTGQLQHWDVWVTNDDPALFEEGAATAVALAHTRAQGEPTDAHQWLVEVRVAR